MIDTHAHIDTAAFDNDREEILVRAFDDGVEYIIIPAIDEQSWDKQYSVSQSDSRLYCGIGVHPHSALEVNDTTFDRMESYLKSNKTVAIGETGLDYYYDFAPRDAQIKVFRRHLEMAKKSGLPVIIHNRESDDDVINIIKEEQDGTLRGVLHCFSGSERMLEEALGLGFNVSFTGNITFKKTTLDNIVKKAPIDRIMLETDSPYMAPQPFRGKRNEPSKIRLIAEKISEYKSLSIQEVISMTTKTAKLLFNLPVLLITFFMASAILSAQSNTEEEEYFDETTEKQDLVNPFPKILGITPFFGSNTVVDQQTLQDGGRVPVSYKALFSWGVGILASPLDYMTLQLSYMGSKSTANSDIYIGVLPDYQNVIAVTSHWTPNPYNRINVYGSLGACLFLIKSNGHEDSSFGINTGAGFNININTGLGLMSIIAEWDLNFSLDKFETTYIDLSKTAHLVETSTFYSIVRVGVAVYPNIF